MKGISRLVVVLLVVVFAMADTFGQVGYDPAFPTEDPSVFSRKKKKKKRSLLNLIDGSAESSATEKEEPQNDDSDHILEFQELEEDKVAEEKAIVAPVAEPADKVAVPDSSEASSVKPKGDGKRYIKTTNVFGFETIIVADDENPAPEFPDKPVTSKDIAKDTYVNFPNSSDIGSPSGSQSSSTPAISAPVTDEKIKKFQYDTDVLIPDNKPGGDAVLGTSLLAPGETIEDLLSTQEPDNDTKNVSSLSVPSLEPFKTAESSPKVTTRELIPAAELQKSIAVPSALDVEVVPSIVSVIHGNLHEIAKQIPATSNNHEEMWPVATVKTATEQEELPMPVKDEDTSLKEDKNGKFDFGESQILIPDPVFDQQQEQKISEEVISTEELRPEEGKKSKFDFGETGILIPDKHFDAEKPTELEKDVIISDQMDNKQPSVSTPIAVAESSVEQPEAGMMNQNLFESSFLLEFEAKKLIKSPTTDRLFAPDERPVYGADEYEQRLEMIPCQLSLKYDHNVKKYINRYFHSNRQQLEKILGRRDAYFPIIESTFIKYGIPTELKYLAVIESGLNPRLNSQQLGTSGLWQLSVENARRFGLDLNSFIDERMDPYLSTDAMARYLKFLYQSFNDWQLVILAYGSGQGELIKAMQRVESTHDIDKIAASLPNRDYLSLFTASMYAMHYYPEHNVQPGNPPYGYYGTDTIVLRKETDLREISRFIGMPLTEVQYLNPAVLNDVVPKSVSGYPINLPVDKLRLFFQSKDAIQGTEENKIAKPKKDDGRVTDLAYTVGAGEKIGMVASKFDCSIADLKRWNKLQSDMLIEGEKLKVFVPLQKFDYYYQLIRQ